MKRDDSIYFLVGIKFSKDDLSIVEESMDELEGLVKTAGGTVAGRVIQNRNFIDPAYYIGKGKLEEIDFLFDRKENQNGVLVFNAALSPAQVRNIEKEMECAVITRTELILDIFALHAHSRIAKLQVEMAQMSYLLPRLVGKGVSLSRTGGGIGTRGPGETKLETDRRKIGRRIAILRKELKHLEKSGEERRKSRADVFKAAIAGYTNAGKSSLATRLIGEELLIENKLFSTIDTTTRKMKLDGIPAVLTDTVGFIRDIPHELVESFKSTLLETVYADVVIHTVDLSSPFFLDKIQTAEKLLEEIEVESPIVLVFNKIDLVSSAVLTEAKIKYPYAFFLSAKDDEGIQELKEFLKKSAIEYLKAQNIDIPDWCQ